MTEVAPSPYLTIIPDRTPKKKAHESLGQAKKAVLYRMSGRDDALSVPCLVYQWKDSGWDLLWKIDAGTERRDLPWVSNGRQHSRGAATVGAGTDG